MIIYLLVLFYTLYMSYIYDGKIMNRTKILPYIILFVFVVLISGLRYRVGIDTLNYMEVYNSLPSIKNVTEIFDSEDNYSIRPLFLLLVVISKLFSNDFWVCQLLHAIILNSCVFYFLYRESKYPFFCVAMYLFVYFFYFNMEIMRESLAVGVFLLARNVLYQRRWVRYCIYVFIASLFHYSAFFMVVYPFVLRLKLNKKFIYILLGSLWGFILLKPVINSLLYAMDSTLLVKKIISYMDYSDSISSVKTFLVHILKYSLLPFIVLFLYKKYSKTPFRYESLVLFHILIGVGVIFYQVIFARFTNYTQPFCVLLYAEFVYMVYRTFLIKNIFCIATSILIFVAILWDYNIQPVLGARRYNQWIPYYSIFNPQRDNIRENIWFKTFE